MTKERFWVIGGEYSAMDFKRLKDGAQQLLGPFEDRAEAAAAWRRVSDENRSRATARFSIAAERISLPG
jgi:hypothetical protein